ncbi:MAG: ABC transporter permease [Oligoflexia bacterium]|nr:ABC transporter permease [Oligoflexia bacterium]
MEMTPALPRMHEREVGTHPDFLPAGRRTAAQVISRPSLTYWEDAWLRLKRNRQALASLGIVSALLLLTLVGPLFWRVDPAAQELNRISESPSFGVRARVIEEPGTYEELTRSDWPESPAAPERALEIPRAIGLLDEPSILAVRLRWEPVEGAAGYVIYRSDRAPEGAGSYGVPVGEVLGGNRLSYEDRFNLSPGEYYYTIVAKNGMEADRGITRKVVLEPGISLADAQLLRADARVGEILSLPSHPLGTDYLGRDLLARLMAGARISLFIGILAPLLWTFTGVLLGGFAGYAGGRVDGVLMRVTDLVMALPFLLFMILFKVVLGGGPGESGIVPMLLSMVVLSWTGPARLARGQVLQLRESEFIQASRLLGASPAWLLFRHLLPNTLGVILVSLTFSIPSAIFTEAFLSFIGMGVVPPTPSWGSMCNDGIQRFLTYPHEFLFPAVFISVTVLAFNLLGDGLRDALDPKMRSVS